MAAAGGVTHSLAAYIPFESVGVQADSSQLTYIVDEAIKALAMIQSAFLFTYGAKEIFFDSRQFQEKVWGGRLCAVSQAIFGIFGDNETSAHDYYLIHGTLFLTSGAYFALSSLHCYQCLDLYGCLDELHLAADTTSSYSNSYWICSTCMYMSPFSHQWPMDVRLASMATAYGVVMYVHVIIHQEMDDPISIQY